MDVSVNTITVKDILAQSLYIRRHLVLSGNIETNPGPPNPRNCLKICHFNARSLMSGVDMRKHIPSQASKLDEICVTLVQNHKFDLIENANYINVARF